VSQKIFNEAGLLFVSFTYLVEVNSNELEFNLKIDEIEEIGWFKRNEAISSASSWFDLEAIKKLTE
jgi:hypothetical protein